MNSLIPGFLFAIDSMSWSSFVSGIFWTPHDPYRHKDQASISGVENIPETKELVDIELIANRNPGKSN